MRISFTMWPENLITSVHTFAYAAVHRMRFFFSFFKQHYSMSPSQNILIRVRKRITRWHLRFEKMHALGTGRQRRRDGVKLFVKIKIKIRPASRIHAYWTKYGQSIRSYINKYDVTELASSGHHRIIRA